MARKTHDRSRKSYNDFTPNKTLAFAGANSSTTMSKDAIESILCGMRDEDVMRASARRAEKQRGKRRR